MKKSIFCLTLSASLAAPMTISTRAADIDKDVINNWQSDSTVTTELSTDSDSLTMFSNINLTDEQKQLLSSLENPFGEDYMSLRTGKTHVETAKGQILDRCGGDTCFQNTDKIYDLVLQELHQQRTDARVGYLQRLSQILTEEQYDQFIQNLDSRGRVE